MVFLVYAIGSEVSVHMTSERLSSNMHRRSDTDLRVKQDNKLQDKKD